MNPFQLKRPRNLRFSIMKENRKQYFSILKLAYKIGLNLDIKKTTKSNSNAKLRMRK